MPRANGITRQEILGCIKIQGPMTAEELARHLGISQVAVRQHLSSLEAERIVVVSVERRGLGRPSHRYALTPEGDETFPRRYEAFANSLLDELRDWQGDDVLSELLSRKRAREQDAAMSRIREKTITGRLNEVARIQTENGYMAEASNDGAGKFTLIKRNCPLSAIARNHPEVCCNMEASVIKSLLGDVEVKLCSSISDGERACRFAIQTKGCDKLGPEEDCDAE